jgi:translation initiation factor 4E
LRVQGEKQPDAKDPEQKAGTEPADAAPVAKHPLQNNWQLWYWRNTSQGTWQDNLLKVAKFNTVEDFWALFHHIEVASNLQVGSDYNLFKDEIEPMWEDTANRKGGRWLFTLNKTGGAKSSPNHQQQLDNLWLEVLLCLIGEAFGEYSNQVNGAVLNIRAKMDKVAVWTTDCRDMVAVKAIGKILKERTGGGFKISYESHADTANKQSSTAKATLTL